MKVVRAFLCLLPSVLVFFFDPSWWIGLRAEVLTFLSILFGAVLFRLGRGLPQLTVDRLDPSEVQRIADAFKIVGDRLVWVFAITGSSIAGVLLTVPLLVFGNDSLPVRAAATATLLLSALSVERAIALVRGDRDLIRLQAELLKKDARKRYVSTTVGVLDEAERRNPFTPTKGYGELHESE